MKKAGVKFHSQVVDRYPRGMILAHNAVESGLMGKMGSANIFMNSHRGQGYYDVPGRWHGTWDGEGGGAVFHHGRYIIDPFLWVVGSRVEELFAYSGPMLRQIEHDSLTQAVVKFANGATGMIHASLIDQVGPGAPGARGHIQVFSADAALEIWQEQGLFPIPRSRLRDDPAAVEALDGLRADVAHLPEVVSQPDQTGYPGEHHQRHRASGAH